LINQNLFIGEGAALFGFGKSIIKTGFENLSDVSGSALSVLSVRQFYQKDIVEKKYKDQGFLNPRSAALYYEEPIMQDRADKTFYTNKLAAESAAYFIGGPATTAVVIGQASRAKSVEEAAITLMLGGATRLASPYIGKGLNYFTGKTNVGLEKYLTKLTTPQNAIVPYGTLTTRKFADIITADRVAKGLLYGGAAAEIGGLEFVPKEYRREYVREVGLFNSYGLVGFKGTDVGLMLGKTTIINVQQPFLGSKVLKTKDLMADDVFAKFSQDGGGTPVLRGPETEQILALQGYGENQKVSTLFKELNIDAKSFGVGGAYRSIDVPLEDLMAPKSWKL